jgi:hypothetical protein
MSALSLSFAPRAALRSEFAPEWCALAVILAVDLVWMPTAGLRVAIGWQDGIVVAVALGAMMALRTLSIRSGGLMAEYFAITAVAATVFGVLSYLCTAHDAPLADGAFQKMDAALGFDWLSWFQIVHTNPLAAGAFRLCYDSLIYQGLYFGLLLALLDRRDDLKEMFWIVFVAGLFTSAGAYLWPAFGPFREFGLDKYGDYIPVIEHLRSGRDLNFPLHAMTGVVSFPSFHTTMALAYVYGFRRTGAIGAGIAVLNIGMLLAIPVFGGHYLTDMIAGAAVLLVSLAIVKASAATFGAMGKARHTARHVTGRSGPQRAVPSAEGTSVLPAAD